MNALARAREAAMKAAIDAQNTVESAGAAVTDAQMKAFEEAINEVKAIDVKVAKANGLGDALRAISRSQEDYDAGDESGVKAAEFLGERFVKSNAYQQFQKENPTGLGEGTPLSMPKVKIGDMAEFIANRKADGNVLGTPVSHPQTLRLPTVDMVDRRPLTLLDLIGKGRMNGNFDYVQITAVSNNAAIVAEATSATDGLKPTSDLTTKLATCNAYTFADGFTVTNQLLSDASAFSSYMQTSLAYNLDSVIEDKILNGSGTQEPMGILKTTGVQQQTYTAAEGVMDIVKAVRLAKAKIARVGGVTTAILLNPEDQAEIDLMQDNDKRFYGNGLFGIGPSTLWGVPVATSEKITKGQALLGDFKQVQLLDREGLSVTAFNQHKDYAQRNLVYVRAELRAGVVTWRPNRLALVKTA